MSEFSKLKKRVDESFEKLGGLQEIYKSDGSLAASESSQNGKVLADFKALNDLRTIFQDDLLAACKRYMDKVDQVDPVTGEARFGPAMREKIRATAQRANECTDLIQEVEILMQPAVNAAQDALRKPQEQAAAEESAKLELQRQQQEELELAKRAEDDKLAEERQKQEHLRYLAEHSRLKRKHLTAVFRALTTVLNDRPRSAEAIRQAGERLRASTVSTSASVSASAFKTALEMVISSLEAISARPDNKKLRRLRVLHPDIQGKILGFEGGLALFLSVGFSVQLVDKQKLDQEQEQEGKSEVRGAFSSAGLRSGGGTVSLAVKPGTGAQNGTTGGSGAGGDSGKGSAISMAVIPLIDSGIDRLYASAFESSDMSVSSSSQMGAHDTEGPSVSASGSTAGSVSKHSTISSSDPKDWSPSQQDYSEFYYLCGQLCLTHAHAPSSSSGTLPVETESGAGASSSNTSSATATTASLSSPLVPLLVMDEPNPETPEGMTQWLAWFDGLKVSIDTLKTLL